MLFPRIMWLQKYEKAGDAEDDLLPFFNNPFRTHFVLLLRRRSSWKRSAGMSEIQGKKIDKQPAFFIFQAVRLPVCYEKHRLGM